MKNFAVVMLAVASVFALSSSAQAGGGGSGSGGAKKNAKIKVTNNTTFPGGVIVDRNPAAVYNTAAEFQAAGGVIITNGNGGTATIDVAAGVHKFAIYDTTTVPFTFIRERDTPSIPKNKTLKALVDAAFGIGFSY